MDAHTSSSNTTGSAPSPHQAGMDAIDQVLARLELSPEGLILDANPHFLAIMGYPLDELKGKHHDRLLSPDEAQSATYDTFWETLRSGTSQEGEFHLLDKQGRDIWIRGACSPVLDAEGQLTRIIVYAMDLTGQKQLTASFEGQLNALSRVMGKVEFSLDGTILDANPRFLDIVGYRLEELKGQHHRLLVDPDYAQSADYRTFWETLRRGEFLAGEFCRLGKQGQEVWIQGSYNPVLDLNGKPSKIVKFATDITAQVEQHRQLKRAMVEAEEAARVREELHKSLQEMSTPVTPIWDGILLLPLVGIIDSMRTADVMNKSLTKIAETRARVFVLDIAGVATVDTGVANQLIKITKATQFMGCEAIISGVSPAIARTMVELGVSVGDVRTTATLRDAFEIALKRVGSTL
ncbi:PAS domain-containing protein [Aeromonas salmonicida]|uniref:PAS domain-containing protein n=1 Tax=Aeromonas salmonicida TaxID=645 RepID=UPI000BB6052D|nr:PAS domain-containing protein [Aeromonas salmonicida]MDM5100877.1 PAS domain-containing protein [Aeromonas salmonicida]PBO13310.1 chemotaxis protein [Aeromonas salmonicida]HDN9022223.1 PAS domain-containing protein [Aeromonas salmonicida]HEH9409550.1 PAS domain-containing protein [Aeromonas salmonicida]